MAKACTEAMPAAEVAEVDRLARDLWRYGEESYSAAWLRAYAQLRNGRDADIPDFWVDPPWLMVECRGYDSDRGRRQVDEFVSLMEVEGGLPLPNGDGNLYEYMVIGPAKATLYTAWGGDLEFTHIKASDRVRYQARPARVYGCGCGWRVLSDWSPWCPDCETMADRSLIISAREGKVYVNGSSVEDFHAA